MEFFLVIVGFILILVLWSRLAEIKNRRLLKERLKREWGDTPSQEYTTEKMDSIKVYYKSKQDSRLDVDDITWNDLDMDEIYMEMNNTSSSIGEEYLYALLRKPCHDEAELKERSRLMDYFNQHETERLQLQAGLHKVGKITHISVYEYINRLEAQKTESNLIHYLLDFALLFSVGMIFVIPGLGGVLTLAFFIINIFHYFSCKAKIENYLLVFSYIFRLLDSCKALIRMELPEIKTYSDRLKKDIAHFGKIQRGGFLLTPKSGSGDILEIILDNLRMLFHLDIIKYNSMLGFFKKNRADLNRIYETIGYLDSMIAAASFRNLIYYYCEPELTKVGKPMISVTELYHPLLEEPVPNSISEQQSVLITGSNASGKSTFIKTLAVNAILSQTIYTATAKSYKGSYFQIYSSMALKDNIFSSESYYIVEIKSLKRILDSVNDEIPTLCFIDEVLRGTNTLERIAASSRILSSLASKNALVFAATHDIELTHILEAAYSNYHFQERIEDHQIIFDYLLYQGKAVSKNAIRLLDMLGYPPEITEGAEQAAQEFLTTGEWSLI
jgi:DNA mismatch repair ATPase MutS